MRWKRLPRPLSTSRLVDFVASATSSMLIADPINVAISPIRAALASGRSVYERDAASAAAEYGSNFRTDIENFVSIEAVKACVSSGTFERAPERGINYVGFLDPSGGSQDAFALAIAHNITTTSTIVIDCLREQRPPFSPEQTVLEFSNVLKTYNISKVQGDRYAGQWPVEALGKVGIIYEQSARPKSDLYLDLLPLINSCRIALLDNAKLINQLVGLERRTSRSGRDSIDHSPGSHDDVCNAVAGVAVTAVSKYGAYDPTFAGFQPDADDDDGRGSAAAERVARLHAYIQTFVGR